MREATKEILEWLDALAEKRKQEILHTKDALRINGTTYYVSNAGDDENDGTSPEAAWKTLKKVAEFSLSPGDGVLFRRGDMALTVRGKSRGFTRGTRTFPTRHSGRYLTQRKTSGG